MLVWRSSPIFWGGAPALRSVAMLCLLVAGISMCAAASLQVDPGSLASAPIGVEEEQLRLETHVQESWTLRSDQRVESSGSSTRGSEDKQGWYDPRINGGRMLDFTNRRYGEPINVIISAHSDPFVLTDDGFHTYAKSIGFSEECLGLHMGNLHSADLGDGNGGTEELFLSRQYYFPVWGTCWESFAGGNHFRAWKQNGTLANSGAWFLGVSKEEDSGRNHMIVENGYNIGRDLLVDSATRGSHYHGMWWRATVEWNEGDLLKPGRKGVNHGIAQDGRVAILTVNRV